MARTTKKTVAPKPVEDFDLSTGQASAVNSFASALARANGKAAVSFNGLSLPKTLLGAAELVGNVSDDVHKDIPALKALLEETTGMTRGQIRATRSPRLAAQAEKRAEAKAKRQAAKEQPAPAKRVTKKVTQKPKAEVKAKTSNTVIDIEAINSLLA